MTVGGSNVRSHGKKGPYRLFDGKRYESVVITSPKSRAEQVAFEYREEGYLARVTETKSGFSKDPDHRGTAYYVWIRRK